MRHLLCKIGLNRSVNCSVELWWNQFGKEMRISLFHDLTKNPSKRLLQGRGGRQPASQVMTAAPKSSVTQLQALRSHQSCLQEGKEQPPSLRSMSQTQNTPSALLRMIDDSLAAEVCDIWFHSLIRLCLSKHLLVNVSRAPT